jgi:hypothetical protein
MAKANNRRKRGITAKEIVLRLAGNAGPSHYPQCDGSTACCLCGAIPAYLAQDALGEFHTIPSETAEGHEPDCVWRLAYEYATRHSRAPSHPGNAFAVDRDKYVRARR